MRRWACDGCLFRIHGGWFGESGNEEIRDGMHCRDICFFSVVYADGWICVHTIVLYFSFFQKLIPWIALLLLSHIGWKMIQDAGNAEAVSGKDTWKLDRKTLMMQGIATSIDALSVGFTIANYHLMEAFTASLIIAAVTFVICIAGLLLGRVFGLKLAGKANILGGVILIGIGIEIFVTNMMR